MFTLGRDGVEVVQFVHRVRPLELARLEDEFALRERRATRLEVVGRDEVRLFIVQRLAADVDPVGLRLAVVTDPLEGDAGRLDRGLCAATARHRSDGVLLQIRPELCASDLPDFDLVRERQDVHHVRPRDLAGPVRRVRTDPAAVLERDVDLLIEVADLAREVHHEVPPPSLDGVVIEGGVEFDLALDDRFAQPLVEFLVVLVDDLRERLVSLDLLNVDRGDVIGPLGVVLLIERLGVVEVEPFPVDQLPAVDVEGEPTDVVEFVAEFGDDPALVRVGFIEHDAGVGADDRIDALDVGDFRVVPRRDV